MNKNTIIALALILLTMVLFTSKQYTNFYYNKILRQKSPLQIAEERSKKHGDSLAVIVTDTAAPEAGGAFAPAIRQDHNKAASLSEADNVAGSSAKKDSLLQYNADALTGIDTIRIETPTLGIAISTLGARIISVKTKRYFYNYAIGIEPPADRPAGAEIELIPQEGAGGANLIIDNVSYDSALYSCAETARSIIVTTGEEREVRFISRGSTGHEVTKTFVFKGEGYRFECVVSAAGLSGRNISFGWQCGINESEIANAQSGNYDQRKFHYSDGNTVQHVEFKKPEHDEPSAFFQWAAITSKYFLVAAGYDKAGNGDLLIDGVWVPALGGSAAKKAQKEVDYRFWMRRAADDEQERFWVYAGPGQVEELKKQKNRLQGVLFSGVAWFLRADIWFPPVCEMVLWLLIKLHGALKDYGVVIVALTILVRVVTFPLTQSSTKSMSRMKDLQPRINAIRQRYKSNPRKMNEEIMALYKQEGINPFNPGCLPLFLQMPVFIALFVVLRKAIELRGATTLLLPWVSDLSQPEALPGITPLFQAVFPSGLPMYGCTVGIMPIIMAALTFVQNKMTIRDPNQKAMIYIMPVFMLVLFNNFASGLVLYWTLSSLLAIIQQWYVDKASRAREAKAVEKQREKPAREAAKRR